MPRTKEITKGQTFDTPFETGCVAYTDSDEYGTFDAFDSDGVLCGYSVSMITAAR